MSNVLFSRTSDPSSKPITDGQLIFDTSGNGKMYLDVGSKRMEMGGARTIDPVLNSSSENPIQNKAVAGVMLDNMTDVNAVTGSGFLPDALSIKELDTDLQGQINTLNSNLEYAHLAQLIGFSSDNLSLFYAYKENGIITLNLNIPHSITGAFSAKINSVYAPRNITYGIASYSSSSNDVDKIPSASITTDGTINVWIAQALDAIETVQFSYPMKRS